MAYRDDARDAVVAPTAEGALRAELAPRHVRLALVSRSLEVSDAFVTVIEHHRRQPARDRRASLEIAGRLVIARDVPRDGFGVWLELAPATAQAGLRRIFGVEPASLLEPGGLAALAALDRLALEVRGALAHLAGDAPRAWELGPAGAGGLDKVLVLDHGDRWTVYARRLFRDRARQVLVVHRDGRIAVGDGPIGEASRALTVRSRHGITVVGDFVRFSDDHGRDLARLAMPWLTPEDRVELARRIGQWIDPRE